MTTTILFIIIGVLAAVLIFVLARKGAGSNNGKDGESSLQLLLAQMNELSRTVDAKLSESQKITTETIRHQTNQSQNIIREVTEHLTELKESNKQVMSFTDQLQSLQDILKNPKQRGILGEYYLETLLKNILPPGSYQMQYAFTDGDIVDAVVFVKDKIIPIDSKFSLENYNRISETSDPVEKERLEKVFLNDLKNRIVETSKYIKPGSGTMEFAFMFIPHEAIYYDLIVNKIGAGKITGQDEETDNLIQRAASRYKVIIVSPTSFLAYLQTVLQGLKAMQIEESAKDIIKRVGELSKHLKSFEDYQNKLGSSINTVVNHYNNSNKEFKKVDKDVMRITGEAVGVEYIEASKIDIEE